VSSTREDFRCHRRRPAAAFCGIFTPGDSNIHTHFQTPDNDKSRHIQKLEIGDGATLHLPAP
jgi:hypothetical protein